MKSYTLSTVKTAGAEACGIIGGSPCLPNNTNWPKCQICRDDLVSFLDIKLLDSGIDSFITGCRLQVFACRRHDDITGTIYSDYSKTDVLSRSMKFPDNYWDISDGHYLIRLLTSKENTVRTKSESRLKCQTIYAEPTEEMNDCGFKMYGTPFWHQNPEEHVCCCGAPMKLILQLPNGKAFPMEEGAEEQPNSFSQTDYCLFLGNTLYLLGCTAQCNPKALWPVLQ